MRRIFLAMALAIFLSTPVRAEQQKWSDIVEYIIWGASVAGENYSRDSAPYRAHVLFWIEFFNSGRKKITGIKFDAQFIDAFGDVLHIDSLKSNDVIGPNDLSTMDTHWYYEDNEFIANQPYDKLKSAASADTLQAKVNVTAIAFDDGTVLTFDEPHWLTSNEAIAELGKSESDKSEWKPASHEWSGENEDVQADFFEVPTRFRVSWLVFDIDARRPTDRALVVKVFDGSGKLVKEIRGTAEKVSGGETFESPGRYRIEVVGKSLDWHVTVHEPNE